MMGECQRGEEWPVMRMAREAGLVEDRPRSPQWIPVPVGTLGKQGRWLQEAVRDLIPRTYCFDLDGTICSQEPPERYGLSSPNLPMIEAIRRLKAQGHTIIIHTARAPSKGGDPTALTVDQLRGWGVPYDRLYLGKPFADVYVDDRGMSPAEFLRSVRAPINAAAMAEGDVP